MPSALSPEMNTSSACASSDSARLPIFWKTRTAGSRGRRVGWGTVESRGARVAGGAAACGCAGYSGASSARWRRARRPGAAPLKTESRGSLEMRIGPNGGGMNCTLRSGGVGRRGAARRQAESGGVDALARGRSVDAFCAPGRLWRRPAPTSS